MRKPQAACNGATGGEVAFAVAMEARHAERTHAGPAQRCTACRLDVANELASFSGRRCDE
ncbi:hypothetical protein GCM10010429_05360 [Micromonospora olivasterospora]